MVLVRRTRKRMSLKKRSSRRLMRKPRVLNQGKLYKFKRTCQALPWYWNGTEWLQMGDNYFSNSTTRPAVTGIFKFRLSDLPNPTDFTSLYEQFKITGVKLRFLPFAGTENSASSGAPFTETCAFAIDRGANDQAVLGPTFDSLLENQDVKLRNSQKGFSIWIGTPTYHQPADGMTQGSYKSGWLDSDISTSRNVDHHGLKWAWPLTRSDATAAYFRVYATYYITCRNPQ